jgi:formate hydrogenlyase transcriptional activator
MEKFCRWQWPGNIRELENFIERAVILTRGTTLSVPFGELTAFAESTSVRGFGVSSHSNRVSNAANTNTLETVEREHILRVLEETDWVIGGPSGAAAQLGLKRTTLQSRMRKLGIIRRP